MNSGPPRVAPVNRSIRLNVVVVRAAERAVARRYDTGRDREPLPQRIAHGNHPVTNARRVAVTKLYIFERTGRFDLKQCDVGLFVRADHLGRQLLYGLPVTGKEFDKDFVRFGDDVVVGYNEPVFGNHKPGTQRIAAAWEVLIAVTVTVLKLTKEILER